MQNTDGNSMNLERISLRCSGWRERGEILWWCLLTSQARLPSQMRLSMRHPKSVFKIGKRSSFLRIGSTVPYCTLSSNKPKSKSRATQAPLNKDEFVSSTCGSVNMKRDHMEGKNIRHHSPLPPALHPWLLAKCTSGYDRGMVITCPYTWF